MILGVSIRVVVLITHRSRHSLSQLENDGSQVRRIVDMIKLQRCYLAVFLPGKIPRGFPNRPKWRPTQGFVGVPKRGGFGDVAEAKKIQAIFMEFF